jgi:predicted transcriptional regulator
MKEQQPKMVHVTLRLRPELRARIKAAAQADRRPESNWMRNALEDRIEQRTAIETEAA